MAIQNTKEKKLKKILSLIFIIILAAFFIYYLYPYINGIFGAFILFVIFNPLNIKLRNKFHIKPSIASIITIIIAIVVILIPTIFIINIGIGQISTMNLDKQTMFSQLQKIDTKYNTNLVGTFETKLPSTITDWFGSLLLNNIQNIINFIIGFIILVFLLYFLFLNHKKIIDKFKYILPFSERNTQKLFGEFKKITFATIITAGIIALIQGIVVAIGFWIFGIKGAIFWGLITFIVSFLPYIGVAPVLIILAIYYLLQSNLVFFFVLIGLTIITSIICWVLLPYLQQKYGQIHPLTSIIGIFIGIPAFGIIGIVMGPLLISFLFLFIELYYDEYIIH